MSYLWKDKKERELEDLISGMCTPDAILRWKKVLKNKRAFTKKEKKKIVKSIYSVWGKTNFRLGQLLCVAIHDKDLFNIEDYELLKLIEELGEEIK